MKFDHHSITHPFPIRRYQDEAVRLDDPVRHTVHDRCDRYRSITNAARAKVTDRARAKITDRACAKVTDRARVTGCPFATGPSTERYRLPNR